MHSHAFYSPTSFTILTSKKNIVCVNWDKSAIIRTSHKPFYLHSKTRNTKSIYLPTHVSQLKAEQRGGKSSDFLLMTYYQNYQGYCNCVPGSFLPVHREENCAAEEEGKKSPTNTSQQVSATEKQQHSQMHSSPVLSAVELECIVCLHFLHASLVHSQNNSAANTERVSCFLNWSDLGNSV